MRFLKSRDGFTLVEVLVAAAVLLIVVLGISTLLMQGYRAMGSAGKKSENLHRAQEEMETAITDPGFGADYEDAEIDRKSHEIEVFGQTVQGTLVTVKRTYAGKPGGEVTYTYFDVDGEAD